MNDTKYMARAIQLAKLASGHTAPNPLVGAVVVKDNKIIGEGFHHKAGTAHAEVHALDQAGEAAKGATLYVTLEPCAHYGKTPPCAKRVVESGISRVVIGSMDPNPLVAGKGIAILEDAGIEVTNDVLSEDCIRMNEGFFTYIQTKHPMITLKSAMSLDGKIATKTGESMWITNESSRHDGHILRAAHDAMLVGVGTILADNPSLNCRISRDDLYESIIGNCDLVDFTSETEKMNDGPANTNAEIVNANIEIMDIHQPDVIILDSLGRTPTDANVFKQGDRKVIIFVSERCSKDRIHELERVGAIVKPIATVPVRKSKATDVLVDIKKLDINAVLSELGVMQYTSVLVEGGASIIASFVEQQLFDKMVTYVGNIIIGGAEAIGAVTGNGIASLQEAPNLTFTSVDIIDNNIRIEAYRMNREGEYVYRNR